MTMTFQPVCPFRLVFVDGGGEPPLAAAKAVSSPLHVNVRPLKLRKRGVGRGRLLALSCGGAPRHLCRPFSARCLVSGAAAAAG